MQQQAAYLSQKTNTINTDMSFLKQLAQPTLQVSSLRPTRANNIDNLAQLLKLKNSRYSFSQQARQTGQEWIRKKGGDLSPLMQKVKDIKIQAKNKQEQKKSESQCYFYMPNLSYQNQDIYIQKNFQFGVLCTVQNIMSQGKNKGNLAKRILNKRIINRQNDQQTSLECLPTINLQIRNPIKKQQYLGATKQIVNRQGTLRGTQWAMIYRAATKQQFWQIITGQIANLPQQSNRNTPIPSLAISSLKMVESQFNSTLPSNYESILYYLTNNYLGKMRGQYDSEGGFGPVWGISYMLYRAGRKQDFYRYVPSQQLMNQFKQADTSIMQGRPKKYSGIQENQDLFQNQLLYALKGVSKCSTQALCDPNALDIVWVFLRNVGIFQQDTNTFISLRKQLYQSYKGPLISQTKIKNLLYLLGYGQIAQIGPNDIMDRDDYLHFLIAVYHSPAFELIVRDKKQIVQNKLTQQLIQYIQQLLLEHKQQYIYYIMVMPKNRISQQISSIISSSQLLQSIDWKYLHKKLPYKVYQKLIKITLQKYVSLYQDYITAAKKQCQLLNNNQSAINYIIQMFIKSILNSYKINKQQIKKGQQLANDIMKKDQNIRMEYLGVFKFFEEYREIIKLIQSRDQIKLFQFLKQSIFILISPKLSYQVSHALQKLIQHKGFQCYLHYLRHLLKAYDITMTRMQKQGDLSVLRQQLYDSLKYLLSKQPYSQFAKMQSLQNVINSLRYVSDIDY